MSILGMIPVTRWLIPAALVAATWQIQNWRYAGQLESQAHLHSEALSQINQATTAQQQTQSTQRLALEQRLAASNQTHYRALTDAQRNQRRLRDRLATADLRLSVLVEPGSTATTHRLPETTAAGGVVHAAPRAQLDRAAAQRIIGIVGDGDRGLIALGACQNYARALSQGLNN